MSKDLWYVCFVSAGFLFINRTEVLPQDLVKFRGWEIRFYIFPISLKFDRHASEFLDRYNLVALIFHEIWR